MPPRTPPYLVPQTAVIPLRAGVDLNTAEEVVDPPKLLDLINATFEEPGIIKKDRGYPQMSKVVVGGTMQSPIRRVLSDGTRQITIAGRALYERLENTSPVVHVERESSRAVFASSSAEDSEHLPDIIDAGSDYVDYAYHDGSGYEMLVSGDNDIIDYVIRERSTRSLLTREQVIFSTTPRAVVSGARIALVYADSSGADLNVKIFNTAGLTVGTNTIVSDYDGDEIDVVEGPAGSNDIYIAYRTATNIKVIQYDVATGSVVNSGTVSRSASSRVLAIARNDSGDDGLLVLWVENTVGLKFTAFDGSCTPGTTTVENASVSTAGSGGAVADCGNGTDAYIFYHDDSTSPDTLQRRVVLFDGTGTVSSRSSFDGGRASGGSTQVPVIEHKPFLFGGNVYIGLSAHHGLLPSDTESWTATCMCDPGDVTLIEPIVFYLQGVVMSRASGRSMSAIFYDSSEDEYRWMGMERRNISDIGAESSKTNFQQRQTLLSLRFYDGATLRVSENLCFAQDCMIDPRTGVFGSVGFSFAPIIHSAASVSGSGGLVPGEVHEYVAIYFAVDKYGNIIRSRPSAPVQMTVGAGDSEADIEISLPFTRLITLPQVALYRTTDARTVHFRLGATGGGTLRSASTVVIRDDEADADIEDREILYTDSGELDNYAPPMGQVWTIHQDRVWSIDEHTGEIRYTKELVRGEGPAWNPLLTVDASTDGLDAKALVSTSTGLWVLGRDRVSGRGAIGVIVGEGPNPQGVGASYQLQRLAGVDVGADDWRTVATIPAGVLFEDRRKGFYLLPAEGGKPVSIGDPIEDKRQEITGGGNPPGGMLAAVAMEDRDEVRFVSSGGRMLVYDYGVGQWSERAPETVSAIVDSTVWGGLHVVTDGTNFYRHNSSSQDDDSSLIIETAWIRLAQFSGLKRVWRLWLLGRYVSTHDLQVEMFYDFNDDSSNSDLYELHEFAEDDIDVIAETTGEVYELLLEPRRQQFQSFKLRVTDSRDAKVGTLGSGYALFALRIEYGVAGRGSKKPSYLRSA